MAVVTPDARRHDGRWRTATRLGASGLFVLFVLASTMPLTRAGDLASSSRATPRAPRTVLVLIPGQPGRALFDGVARGITAELLGPGHPPAAVAIEHLYDSQAPAAVLDLQLRYLRARYAHRRVDAVIAYGHRRYATVREDLDLGTVPMVWLVEATEPAATPPLTVIVRAQGDPTPDSYIASRTLLPPGHHVALVGGGTRADLAINGRALDRLRVLLGRERVHDLTNLAPDTLRHRVAELPRETFLLFGSAIADPAGRPLTSTLLLAMLGPVAPRPVLVTADVGFGQGVTGGLIYEFDAVGRRLARIARRLLAGESPQVVGPQVLRPALVFDARELARLGIPRDRVPAGAVLRFDRPSVWQEYRAWIVAGGTVLVVQTALIAGLLAERRRRRESQERLAERLKAQALVARISTQFANVPGRQLDAVIMDSLQQLGTALETEECALWTWRESDEPPRLVCRWTIVPGPIRSTSRLDAMLLTWARPRLERGEEVHVPDISDVLPAIPDGTPPATVLCLPLRVDGRVIGALSLRHAYSQAWSRQVLGDVRTIGEIIATAVVRKRADASMREQLEALAHVNRVAGLGELAASIAHELNQPLAAILSNAEAAQALLGSPHPRLDDVRAILTDVIEDDERAGRILRNVRSMLRKHRVDAIPVDVNAVVREVARLVAHDARLRGGALDMALADALPRVTIDPTQLKQVLLNLVVNAVDALAASESPSRTPIELRTLASGDGALIEVRDHGAGVPADILPRLFDPFFTTKTDGLGVGLAISRSIVEAAGGRIGADNAPGGGARVRVWLPASVPQAPPAPCTSSGAQALTER